MTYATRMARKEMRTARHYNDTAKSARAAGDEPGARGAEELAIAHWERAVCYERYGHLPWGPKGTKAEREAIEAATKEYMK